MIKLQTLVFPNIDMPASEDMYFRGQESGAISFLSTSTIDLPERAYAIFDTFFNGFSVRPWKENCAIDDLGFAVMGQGRVRIRVGVHVLNHASRWIQEEVLDLSDSPVTFAIGQWSSLSDGILYVHVTSLTDAEITGGYFYTNTPPKEPIKMGIVITHFNRKQYVLPAIERISRSLLQDPDLEGLIDLVVVDNSQNISADESARATILPNKNLGGAGGFTRGLLHLKDNNFTHCLFMDDDASCEIEAIRRTLRLMQYSRNPKMAVAGSMLREARPYEIHEIGAVFRDGKWKPLKSGLDTRNVHDLLRAEQYQETIGYGGWWHFAFKIESVEHFAFPFFVRGDDTLFSMMNPFKIVTMNGIGGWAEDFGIKENPFVRYLGMRCTITLMLLTSRSGPLRYIRAFYRPVRDCLYSYNYSSARAYRLALEHVMTGPDFWVDNIDMVAVRDELAKKCPDEKNDRVILPKDTVNKSEQESRIRRFIRKSTMNGFLLPSFLIKNRTVVDNKWFVGSLARVYKNRRVAYLLPNSNLGYIAHHDKKRFFIEYALAIRTIAEFVWRLKKIRKQYRVNLAKMTSESFWRNIYK